MPIADTSGIKILLCCTFLNQLLTSIQNTADWNLTHVRRFLTTLRPAAAPLMSRNARRNSPAFPGSMLSWRRRDSSPAPGRQSGRIPEWHTDTFTDIKTVQQADCEASWPRWDGADWAGGGVWVHPPELSDMPPPSGYFRREYVVLTLQYQPGLFANMMFGDMLRLLYPDTYTKVAALSSLF